MLSFGWSEVALIVIVVVIVIGPKEIPNLLKTIGKFSNSLKKISREFKSSLNEISNEGDLKDIKKSINNLKNIKDDIDPTNQLKKEFSSVKDTINVFENDIKKLDESKKIDK